MEDQNRYKNVTTSKGTIFHFIRNNITCVLAGFLICLALNGIAWATDTDGDNIPDEWENMYSLDPNNPNDADLDLDSDSYNNLCEYLHNTIPNNSNSVPTNNITISVPTNVNTIQRSINASIANDKVILTEGTYYEHINFNGKAITLISTDPNDPDIVSSTIINANSTSIDVVTFNTNETNSSILEGITLIGGRKGIYCSSTASPVIKKCTIRNNSSIGLNIYSITPTTIYQCTILNNNSYAIYGNGNITLSNCIIAKNTYGIYVNSSDYTFRIINCSVYGNSSGILGYADEVKNCIVWNNGDDLNLKGGVLATYSCIEDGDQGTGNFSINPIFVNVNTNDYHLWYTSECIDAGDPNSDYSNEPGNGGGRINIGAYGNTSEAVVIIDNDNDGISDDWEFDNFLDANDANDAILDMDGDSLRNIDEYNIAWDPNHFDTINGLVTNTRTSYKYPTITLAMSTVHNNDTLILDPNTFNESINYNGKAITLTSTDPNDPDIVSSTIINANSTSIDVVTFNSGETAYSILEGITLTGGRYGIYCSSTVSPVIKKCTIRNNNSGGMYLPGAAPTIQQCTIRNNNYYGIYGSGNIILRNCIIAKNTYRGVYVNNSSGTFRIINCTVYGNTAYGIYGYADEVTNCIVWNNSNDLNLNGGVLATYSCIEDGDQGTGNLSINPMFVNVNENDYHLSSNSVCIDTGTPWFDYSNEPSPNGGRINLGAYGNTDEATTTTDTDGDGISDAWEAYYWPGDDPNQHDPGDNTDGDNFTNLSEFLYGYNPTSQTNKDIQVFYMEVDTSQFNPTLEETATIYYWINADCNTVLDFNDTSSNEIVKSISQSATVGLNQFSWDGKDDEGLIADNLTYLIEVRIVDVNPPSYFGGNSINIDYSNDVSNVRINPYRILPLNNEVTTITFDLSIKEDVIVSVFDPNGSLFWTASVGQSDPNEVIWSGRNTDETKYPSLEGEYNVEVRCDGMEEKEESVINVYK